MNHTLCYNLNTAGYTVNSALTKLEKQSGSNCYEDGNFVDEHALTAAISQVRNKIETDGRQYIKIVYSMGYIFHFIVLDIQFQLICNTTVSQAVKDH